jgi:flagellar hook-length control protein FliK
MMTQQGQPQKTDQQQELPIKLTIPPSSTDTGLPIMEEADPVVMQVKQTVKAGSSETGGQTQDVMLASQALATDTSVSVQNSESVTQSGSSASVQTAHPVEPQHVMTQVVSAARLTINQNGQQEMTVRLDPPELGTIHLKVATQANGEMVARIETPNPVVRDMLDSRLAELRQSLFDSGIRVDRCTVALDMQWNGQSGQSPQQFMQADSQQGGGRNYSPMYQQGGTGGDQNEQDQQQQRRSRWATSRSLDYLA